MFSPVVIDRLWLRCESACCSCWFSDVITSALLLTATCVCLQGADCGGILSSTSSLIPPPPPQTSTMPSCLHPTSPSWLGLTIPEDLEAASRILSIFLQKCPKIKDQLQMPQYKYAREGKLDRNWKQIISFASYWIWHNVCINVLTGESSCSNNFRSTPSNISTLSMRSLKAQVWTVCRRKCAGSA